MVYWVPNGPRPVICQIYFIDWGVLALYKGVEYIFALRVCSLQPWWDIVPTKPYVDLGSDLKVTWAQKKSITFTCFGNYEILATFRHKFLIQKNPQENALEHLVKKIAIS